jgi:hypothetical protein
VKLHNVGKLLQRQIQYNGKIFRNERGRCNEGWLYHKLSVFQTFFLSVYSFIWYFVHCFAILSRILSLNLVLVHWFFTKLCPLDWEKYHELSVFHTFVSPPSSLLSGLANQNLVLFCLNYFCYLVISLVGDFVLLDFVLLAICLKINITHLGTPCPSKSSHKFWVKTVLFYKWLVWIFKMCMCQGFWFPSLYEKITSWTSYFWEKMYSDPLTAHAFSQPHTFSQFVRKHGIARKHEQFLGMICRNCEKTWGLCLVLFRFYLHR